jgi:polysaccharide biosynthesis protein PslG
MEAFVAVWRASAKSCSRGADRARSRRVAVLGLLLALVAGCAQAEEPDRRAESREPVEFGISSGGAIEYAAPAVMERELDGYVELGARWVRFDVKWELVEARRGVLDWSAPDRVVAAANARGLRVLATVTYAPDWARPGGSDNRIDADAYARFAAAAVRRYAPRGVRHYELWNEPNVRTFWEPFPSPAAYARLVKAAYPAMKAADPSITVLAGALAPVGGYNGPRCRGGVPRVNPIPFLRALYAHGAGDSFDALSYHPYTDGVPSGDHPCNAWRQLDATTPSLRSVMEEAGDGDKPIWATEFGAHVAEVGERRQAERLREAMELWPRYEWAGPFMAYTYRVDFAPGFNLVRNDWTRRPAWYAYRDAVAAGD